MTINNTIDSYRKRRNQQLPLILGGIVVLLVVVGIIFLVVSLSGGGLKLFATQTPTPTNRFTPTNTRVPTNTPTTTETPTITSTPTASAAFNYTVKSGDTLTSIIQAQGLGDNAIINILILNPGINLDLITPGDVIILPAPNSPLLTPTPIPTGLAAGTRISYLVLPGDSLGLIATKFNSTVAAIVAANKTKLGTSTVIHPGWTLLVPINIATPVPTRKIAATSTATVTPSKTP